MNAAFSPYASEFQIQEQVDDYTHWLLAKLERAGASATTKPMVPRDQAMT